MLGLDTLSYFYMPDPFGGLFIDVYYNQQQISKILNAVDCEFYWETKKRKGVNNILKAITLLNADFEILAKDLENRLVVGIEKLIRDA